MDTPGESDDLLKEAGIYFYFPEKYVSEESTNYTSLAVLDGLTQLGYPCFSNVACPRVTVKPLSEAARHVVVFDVTGENYSDVLMRGIAEFQARAKLIHSRSDESGGMVTPNNVTSVMTHESRFAQFRQQRLPWGFGLSRARLERHVNDVRFEWRRPVLLRNFRPSMNQSVRELLDIALLPLLEKHFEIDRTCAVEGYAKRLATSAGCLAYCGAFHSELTHNPVFRKNPSLMQIAENRTLLREAVVIRWDSWRFWESLAAGCLTFQLDFEKYGFLLPEMPVAWQHYVPIDLTDLKGTVEQLMDRKPEWESIARAGRAWALEHYTPIPTAQRFARICRAELDKAKPAPAVAVAVHP